MIFFERLKEAIQDFIRENTKITIGIVGILILLVLSAVAIAAFQDSKKKEKTKTFVFPEKAPFSAAETFFPPEKRKLTEEYYFSREQTSKWSEEEFDRWFTVPTKEAVETLGESNIKTADEILGAAP